MLSNMVIIRLLNCFNLFLSVLMRAMHNDDVVLSIQSESDACRLVVTVLTYTCHCTYVCTGWRPQYGLTELVDAAFDYERAESDPRVVWYPG